MAKISDFEKEIMDMIEQKVQSTQGKNLGYQSL